MYNHVLLTLAVAKRLVSSILFFFVFRLPILMPRSDVWSTFRLDSVHPVTVVSTAIHDLAIVQLETSMEVRARVAISKINGKTGPIQMRYAK